MLWWSLSLGQQNLHTPPAPVQGPAPHKRPCLCHFFLISTSSLFLLTESPCWTCVRAVGPAIAEAAAAAANPDAQQQEQQQQQQSPAEAARATNSMPPEWAAAAASGPFASSGLVPASCLPQGSAAGDAQCPPHALACDTTLSRRQGLCDCAPVHYLYDTSVVVLEHTASQQVAKECAAVSFCFML